MAVYGAYSSEEAKNIIRQHDIQVIVCDIEMAEESGLDFLRWMRTEGYFAKLIFLTAHARFDYAKESITLGATEYLMKPVVTYFKGYCGSCAESLAGGRKAGVPSTGI